MAEGDTPQNKNPRDKTPEPVSGAEWAVAGVGLALLLGTVGVLAREAVTSEGRPPDVTVAVDSVVQGRGGWLVQFRARNDGDETAAMLVVRGTLTPPGGGAPVEREAQVDYLPAHSERGGGLVFPADPRAGTLRLEAASYEEP